MPKKPKVTRTINPLHFEDLEPHRFEDLGRRLLYGFREWSSIEPTGRSGSDEGFDVRAWEKGALVTNVGEEGEEGAREFEGRLWQVQSKREKTWVLKKYSAKTPLRLRTYPAEFFLSLTSLIGNLQNGPSGWAEEPHQALDVLHCRCKEELLTHELDPT